MMPLIEPVDAVEGGVGRRTDQADGRWVNKEIAVRRERGPPRMPWLKYDGNNGRRVVMPDQTKGCRVSGASMYQRSRAMV